MDSATQRRASTSTSSSHGHRESVKRLTEGLFSFLHLYPSTHQVEDGDSDDEQDIEIFSQHVEEFHKTSKRLVTVPHKRHNCHRPINFELILHAVTLTACLLLGSNTWKWIVLFNMVRYGYPLISTVTRLLEHFMCNNSWVKKKRKGVYFIKGMRQSVNLLLFSSLLLLVWLLWFRTSHRMKKTDYTDRLLHLGTWSLVEVAVLWVLKSVLLLMLEAYALYGRFSAMISSAWCHLYLLSLIFGWRLPKFPPQSMSELNDSELNEAQGIFFSAIDAKLYEIKMMAQCFIKLSKACSREDDEASNFLLLSQKLQRTEYDRKPYLRVEDFMHAYELHQPDAELLHKFLLKDHNKKLVTYKIFQYSMIMTHKNCVSLGHTLLDVKEVIEVLSSVMNVLLLAIVSTGWLLLFNIELLVLASALLLLATFAFRRTCKMMFEGIEFSLIKHPFNVGDVCTIDERDLEVKRMGIMSTTFAEVGTNRKALYPNSVLISKPIRNLNGEIGTTRRVRTVIIQKPVPKGEILQSQSHLRQKKISMDMFATMRKTKMW